MDAKKMSFQSLKIYWHGCKKEAKSGAFYAKTDNSLPSITPGYTHGKRNYSREFECFFSTRRRHDQLQRHFWGWKEIRLSRPLIPRNAANDESVKKNTIKTFVSSPSFQSFKACCCTAGISKFSHVRHSLEQCPALVYENTTQGSSKDNAIMD